MTRGSGGAGTGTEAGDSKRAVEVSAGSVDEAIVRGLVRLGGLSRDEVEIEVLREAKSGVLGFGASDAVVRLTPRSDAGKPAVRPAAGADGGAAADRQERSERGRQGQDHEKDRDRNRDRNRGQARASGSDAGGGTGVDAGRGARRSGSERAGSSAPAPRSQVSSDQPAHGAGADDADGSASSERRRRRRRRRSPEARGSAGAGAGAGTGYGDGERTAEARGDRRDGGIRDRAAAARSGAASRDSEERQGQGQGQGQGQASRGRSGGGRPSKDRSRSGRSGSPDRSRGRSASSAPVEREEYEPRSTFSLPSGAAFDVASSVLGTLLTELGFEGFRIDRGADLLPKEAGMDDESEVVSVHGGGTEALLDEEGDSLDALQFVTRLIVSRATGEWATLLVDVEDDRRRQIEELFSLAQQSADLVESDGRAVSLPPMNAYERRVVHIALRDHPTIATQSIGEGDRRKVTVRRRDQLLPEL